MIWIIVSIRCSLWMQHPSGLSAGIRNINALWCSSSFFFFSPTHRNVVIGRRWKTCTGRVSFATTNTTTTTSVKRRPYSNCRQLCHSLRQKWCIDREVAEASAVQCNGVWDVCVTGGHILYMSACSVQQQLQSERRTHRDHLLFLFPGRTAADNPIRCGCRSERPGWRTICSLAVQGWSG